MEIVFDLLRITGIAAAVLVAAVTPHRQKFQKLYKLSWCILVISLIGAILIIAATFLATKIAKIIF